MPICWVSSHAIQKGKAVEYQKWLSSEEARSLFAQLEDETGARYMGTYGTILFFGAFDAETWFELKDYAALGDLRESKTWEKFFEKVYKFIDDDRPSSSRLLRRMQDIRLRPVAEK